MNNQVQKIKYDENKKKDKRRRDVFTDSRKLNQRGPLQNNYAAQSPSKQNYRSWLQFKNMLLKQLNEQLHITHLKITTNKLHPTAESQCKNNN